MLTASMAGSAAISRQSWVKASKPNWSAASSLSARHLVGDGGQADHGKLRIVLPQTQIRLRVDAAHPSESGNCY